MPAVVPLAFGFLAGLLAGLLRFEEAWLAGPACALAAVLLRRRAAPLAVLATGAAAGVLWGAGAAAVRAGDCRLRWRDGERVVVRVEPRDLPLAGRAPRYTLREPGCRGAVRLAAIGGDALPDRPVRVVATWRRDAAALSRSARPERAGRLVVRRARPVAEPVSVRARARLGAERRLLALFGPERAPLAVALTVSPEAALPRAEREAFTRAGLAHLLSISGFHVGVLAAAVVLMLRAARLPPNAARLSGTVLVAGYVWMLGAPAPAVRSAALLALWAVSRARRRAPEWRSMLAVTAIVVLAADPYAAFEAGAWLSFAGIYGCVVAERWWRRLAGQGPPPARAGWYRAVLRPVAASAGASLTTAPITIAAFGTATPAAVVANLAAVPLAGVAVPAIALALVLAALPWPFAHTAAGLAAAAAGLVLDLLAWVTALAGRLPGAQLEVVDRALYAVLAALAAAILLRPPALRPAPVLGARLVARAAAAGLVLLGATLWRPGTGRASGYREDWLTLHFLAVGQGDAVLARTPHGRWILVDGGPRTPGQDAGARIVVPFLRQSGARTLDLVVASHGDADHLGGLPAVLEALEVRRVWEPGEALPRPLYREWLAALGREHAAWRPARAGDRMTLDGLTLRVWHPDSAFLARGLEPNENSVVVSLEFGAFRAVLTGDAGRPMEEVRAAAIGRASLLKVGHHGSRSASGPAWLAALAPTACVIPVGRNRYGHPTAEVLATLARAGCSTWRTDRDGTVTVTTDGRQVRLAARGRDTTFFVRKEQP